MRITTHSSLSFAQLLLCQLYGLLNPPPWKNKRLSQWPQLPRQQAHPFYLTGNRDQLGAALDAFHKGQNARFAGRVWSVQGRVDKRRQQWPDIRGLDSFAGEQFHSARWNHDLDLRGKRVAVIGIGASAIQFIPELQPLVRQLTVFQRTPPWVVPRHDHATTPQRQQLFRRYAALQRLSRQIIFAQTEAKFLSFSNRKIGALGEQQALAHLHEQVGDPALRAKLTPSYRMGCKRVLISDDYYPALGQPNVELVNAAVTEVRGNKVYSADGQVHEADVLICGTGFEVTQPPAAKLVFGRDGRSMAAHWSDHMEALHGTAVAGFPNFFLLVGPNSALGHNSIVYMIEAQVEYMLQALKYLDEKGRNSTLWPELASRYRRTLRHFRPDLYDVRLSAQPPQPVLKRA